MLLSLDVILTISFFGLVLDGQLCMCDQLLFSSNFANRMRQQQQNKRDLISINSIQQTDNKSAQHIVQLQQTETDLINNQRSSGNSVLQSTISNDAGYWSSIPAKSINESFVNAVLINWISQALSGLTAAIGADRLRQLRADSPVRLLTESCLRTAPTAIVYANCLTYLQHDVNNNNRHTATAAGRRRRRSWCPTSSDFRATSVDSDIAGRRQLTSSGSATSATAKGAAGRCKSNRPTSSSVTAAAAAKSAADRRRRRQSSSSWPTSSSTTSAIAATENFAWFGRLLRFLIGLSGKDSGNAKILSPSFFKLFDSDNQKLSGKTKKRLNNNRLEVISPSFFSFHNSSNSILPLPQVLQDFAPQFQSDVKQFILNAALDLHREKLIEQQKQREIQSKLMIYHKWLENLKLKFPVKSGSAASGQNISLGQPLSIEDALKSVGPKTQQLIKSFDRIYKSLTPVQTQQIQSRGYSFLSVQQQEEFYAPGGPFGTVHLNYNPYKLENLSDYERDNFILEQLAFLKSLRLDPLNIKRDDVSYKATREEIPHESFNYNVKPELPGPITYEAKTEGATESGGEKKEEKNLILNPMVFSPFILEPSVLGPVILSPMVFSPAVLSPTVLGPYILSPQVGFAQILSPVVLGPFILSPTALSPFVLSPQVLSPVILSPGVLNPLVLSPLVLSPLILSPQELSPLILSPKVLSPFIESEVDLSPEILSPSVLSD